MNDRQVAPSPAPGQIDTPAWVRGLRLWPGVVMLAVTVWFTASAGVSVASIGWYLLAFVWSVLVPGGSCTAPFAVVPPRWSPTSPSAVPPAWCFS